MKKASLLLVLSSVGLLLAGCGEEQSSSVAPSSSEAVSSEVVSSEESSEVSSEEPEPSSEWSLDPNVFGQNAADPFATLITEDVVLPKAKTVKLGSGVSILNSSYQRQGLLVTRNDGMNVGFYSTVGGKYIIPNSLYSKYLAYEVTSNAYVGFILKVNYRAKITYYDAFGNVLVQDKTSSDYVSIVTSLINEKLYYSVYDDEELGEDHVTYYELQDDATLKAIEKLPEEEEEEEEEYEGPEIGDIVDGGEEAEFGQTMPSTNFGVMDLSTVAEKYLGWHMHWNNGVYFYTVNAEGVVVARFQIAGGIVGYNARGIITQTRVTVGEEDEVFDYIDGSGAKYVLQHHLYDLATGKEEEIDLDIVIDSVLPYLNESGAYAYGLVIGQRIDAETRRLVEGTRSYIADNDLNVLGDVTAYAPGGFVKLPNGYFLNYTTTVLYDAEMKEVCSLAGNVTRIIPAASCFLGNVDGKYGFIGYDGKAISQFVYDGYFTIQGQYAIMTKGGKYVALDLAKGTSKELVPTSLNTYSVGGIFAYRGYDNETGDLYYYDVAGNLLLKTDDVFSTSNPGVSALSLKQDAYIIDRVSHQENEFDEEGNIIGTKINPEVIAIGTFYNPFDKIVSKGSEVKDHIKDGSPEYPYDMVLGSQTVAANFGSYVNATYFEYVAPETGYFQIDLSDDEYYQVYDSIVVAKKSVDDDGYFSYSSISTSSFSHTFYDTEDSSYLGTKYYRSFLLEEGETYRIGVNHGYKSSYQEIDVNLEKCLGRNSVCPEIVTRDSQGSFSLTSVWGRVYASFTPTTSGIYTMSFDDDTKYGGAAPALNFESGYYLSDTEIYLAAGSTYRFSANLLEGKTSKITLALDATGYDELNPLLVKPGEGATGTKITNNTLPVYGMVPASSDVDFKVRLTVTTNYSGYLYYGTSLEEATSYACYSGYDNHVDFVVEAGKPMVFKFLSSSYNAKTVSFSSSVVASTPAYESNTSVEHYLVGKGVFAGSEWTIDTDLRLHSSEDNKGSILNVAMQAGDVFKIVDKTGESEAWLGYESVGTGEGAEFNAAHFTGVEDGNGGFNIKCTVNGTYNIYLNSAGKIYFSAYYVA